MTTCSRWRSRSLSRRRYGRCRYEAGRWSRVKMSALQSAMLLKSDVFLTSPARSSLSSLSNHGAKTMKLDCKFAVALIACAAIGGVLIEGSFAPAAGQSPPLRQQIVGTWAYVHNYNVMPDGKRTEPQGPQGIGKGIFILDSNGRFVWNLIRSDIPKFASNNRQNGSDAENKAAVQGTIAYYGTYEVDEASKSLIMRIEYSSFPNFNGVEQRRTVKLENDELTVINSTAASGGTANL